MNDRPHELSRRTVLGSIGTIGVAAAGAGLSTRAYFTDEETLDGNDVVAGSLDMTVGWKEHHYGAGEYATGLSHEPVWDEAAIPDGTLTTDWRGLPTPDDPVVHVHENDVPRFLDNTALEAYPDVTDDGTQDEFDTSYRDLQDVGPACEDGADVATDMDPTTDDALRTLNEDTYDPAADEVRPLVHVEDVHPGDFGGVTFSLHLCDNPGYVWLRGERTENADNEVVEPESAVDSTPDTGELEDALQVVVWYDEDPGDTVYEPESGAEEAILGLRDGVHTEPVSLAEAMQYLEDGHGVPLDGAILNNPGSQPDSLTFEELTERATDDARNRFVAESSYYVGLAWWLPRDVGNEVQTDSVQFDLGFYAEQARHNDGAPGTETQ